MQWGTFVEWLSTSLLSQSDAVMRLLLAAALGGIIGLERGASGKPAGFRTNLLICLGSTLVMEISASVAMLSPGGDPSRIGSQIISGIGFLGAGTILHFRGNVIGLTTAATLWVVAAIGMAVGAQAYLEAVVATILVMVTLRMLGRLENQFMPPRHTEHTIDLILMQGPTALQDVETLLLREGFSIETLKVERGQELFYVSYQARGDALAWDRIMKQLLALDVVRKVELL